MPTILSPYTLKWMPGGNESNEISVLIRDSYEQHFNATLTRCMSWLLGLYNAQGELKAACGIQLAGQETLYLEQYLDKPVEVVLSSQVVSPVSRASIVEVGNFAACDGASARIMYAAVCRLLNHYHYAWIVFTGTKKIRNIFYRLNLNPLLLTPAHSERLGESARQWGSYYQNDPLVMAGELAGGQTALRQSSLLLSLLLSLFAPLPDAPWAQVMTEGGAYVSEKA